MSDILLPLFPSFVMVSELVLDNRDQETMSHLIDNLEFIKTSSAEATDFTNDNIDENNASTASSISQDVYLLDKPELAIIRNKLAGKVNEYIDHLKYEGSFDFSTSWPTLSKPGEESHYHSHNNAIFTGVYYLRTARNCGKISFCKFEGTTWGIRKKEANTYNSTTWKIPPSTNKLVIFPSQLPHKINLNRSKEPRISLAFNVVPLGQIGSGDSSLQL